MARIAIIVGQLFEDSEFRIPYDRLKEAGHQVDIVGVREGEQLRGKKGAEKIRVEKAVGPLTATEYDALVIPGGYSPDHLRMHLDMVRLTREMFDENKPVAAICHAGWMLVEADIARGRTVTSWPSIKTDLTNAGAHWVDHELVEDGNLITSRNPGDLDVFVSTILRQLEHGVSERIQPSTSPETTPQQPPSLH